MNSQQWKMKTSSNSEGEFFKWLQKAATFILVTLANKAYKEI